MSSCGKWAAAQDVLGTQTSSRAHPSPIEGLVSLVRHQSLTKLRPITILLSVRRLLHCLVVVVLREAFISRALPCSNSIPPTEARTVFKTTRAIYEDKLLTAAIVEHFPILQAPCPIPQRLCPSRAMGIHVQCPTSTSLRSRTKSNTTSYLPARMAILCCAMALPATGSAPSWAIRAQFGRHDCPQMPH